MDGLLVDVFWGEAANELFVEVVFDGWLVDVVVEEVVDEILGEVVVECVVVWLKLHTLIRAKNKIVL